MSRYSTYGALDDRIGEDLEAGFIGFNNRLRPDQLTSGILFDSKNGRMAQNTTDITRANWLTDGWLDKLREGHRRGARQADPGGQDRRKRHGSNHG